jgi:2-isopropylmalate synthase
MKELESEGYQFEAAEASFELLMREALEQRPSFFELQGFQVHCDQPPVVRIGAIALWRR